MKSARALIWVAATAMGLSGAAKAETPDDTALIRALSTTAQAPARPSIDSPAAASVRQAADPSAAISAYSTALQMAPADIAVKRAFVQRMVDFGLPELVETQAQELLKSDSRDGLAWAVSAYMQAKRDQTDMAFRSIEHAVKYQPDDVFVVRTAAQLVAWYDTQADKLRTPADVKTVIDSVRQQFAANATFSDAYSRASDIYRSATTSSPQQPAAPVPAAPQPTQYVPEEPTNVYNYYTYPTTYYDSGYDYAYWWPSGYRRSAWWWPTFTSIVIINKDFDHRKRCDDLSFFVHRDRSSSFVRKDVPHHPSRVSHGRFADAHGRFDSDALRRSSTRFGDRDLQSPSALRTPTLARRDIPTPSLSQVRTPTFGQRQSPIAVTSPPNALRMPAGSTSGGTRSVSAPINSRTITRQPAISRSPTITRTAPTPAPRSISTPRSTSVPGPAISRAPSDPRVTGISAGGSRSTFSAPSRGSGSRGMQGPATTFGSRGMSGGRSMR